jgi:hypothetical protein
MTNSSLRRVSWWAIALALVPATAAGQPIARSFADLQTMVKVGETVLVRDQRGREAKVKIAAISASSLSVLKREKTRDNHGFERATWTAKQLLSEGDVQRIRRSGGNATKYGALIGAAAAFVPTAAFAAAYGRNEGGGFCQMCLGVSIVTVPMGAGIGAGVGAIVTRVRRHTIYLPPDRASAIR